MEQKTVKGFKVFNPDFTCKGVQFEEGKTFEIDGPIQICHRGLHFCTKASHCFSYYTFDPNNIVCEVEAIGEVQGHDEDSKMCTDKLRILRRLTWQEVLVAANEGANNTGHSNSGNWNSGNRNSGDSNSGYRNSGDSNSGYRAGGAFCSDPNPKLIIFDKPCEMTILDWERSEAVQIMSRLLENTMWIYSENMSPEEKQKNPSHETTGGYLKVKTMKEAWADMWGNLGDNEKAVFTKLPNFDSQIFERITGINIK